MAGMINDLVPTGFSSAAAMKLLKTMNSTMENNSSYLATANATTFDTTSKKTLSGDTMFSIIAAAASTKAAAAPASTAVSPSIAAGQATTVTGIASSNPWLHSQVGSAPADAIAGQDLAANDMYLQKSYTVAQATDIWYGQTQLVADSSRRSPDGNSSASNGTIIASQFGLTGSSAASFATAYDSRTINFSDPNDISGLNSTVTHTVLNGPDGIAIGESGGQTFDENVFSKYQEGNPNSLIASASTFGSWQGVVISW